MGKSRKKCPAISGIIYNGSKKRANKKVRQLLKNPEMSFTHNKFKRCYCSWDIRDYREVAPSFETFYKKRLAEWTRLKNYFPNSKNYKNPPTKEQCLKEYLKWYVRK